MKVPSVGNAARGVSSPLRAFFNQHFEMVKAEVRATDARPQVDALRAVVTDLESDLIEQSLHQARVMARVRADVEHLADRIGELERLIERLNDVAAAAMLEDADESAGRRRP